MAAASLSRSCADNILDVLPGAMDAIRAGMRSQLANQLSVPQFRCLNFIDPRPGCSVGDVAAFLGVTMPTASAMVDRLVRAGHLRAASAASDRRRVELSISEIGKALLEQVREDARGELAALLARRSADELRAISAGLVALKKALS